MKLEMIKYKCADCAHAFDAPALGESTYGEFLLWSRAGSLAYLNAIKDPTYKEVDALLSKHPKTAGMRPIERAKVLRRIYGELACDLGDKGTPFEIEGHPPCPTCGSQKMESWEFKNPPEIVDMSVPPVTHSRWSALSDSEKFNLLDVQLSQM